MSGFTGDAEFCYPLGFSTFKRQVERFDFDAMLEANAKNLPP